MAKMLEEALTWPRVLPREVLAFTQRCMEAAGTSNAHATAMAELLVAADQRGHYSHGLNRLEMYVRDIQTKITVCDKEPEVLKETPATAWVEGHNLLGPVVGKFCTDLAIKKAKEVGIGWVIAKGSNHYGIAGWYSMRAADHGLVGICATNTSPLVVPTRAKQSILGTNPLAVAAPAGKDSFCLDMATSAVALGKIEINHRRGENIPSGWGCDRDGKETHDTTEVLQTGGGLLPLGGMEETSGYKGYGLAMMVELFCGILGGAHFGSNIRSWKTTTVPADLGQCFAAIDPSAFAPGFEGRLDGFLKMCRELEPLEGETEVLIPGDPEKSHEHKCDELGGIPYHPKQLSHLDQLGTEMGVQLLQRVDTK